MAESKTYKVTAGFFTVIGPGWKLGYRNPGETAFSLLPAGCGHHFTCTPGIELESGGGAEQEFLAELEKTGAISAA